MRQETNSICATELRCREVGGGGGGYSPQFRMGVCCWVPGNLTLFQIKETQFCYPVLDKMVKISYPVPEHETQLTFEPGMVCLSKHAVGPKHEQQEKILITLTMFQSQNEENYTLSQTETLIYRPQVFQTQRGKNQQKNWHIWDLTPFTTKSDQCQISPATSSEILHHTVWRT